MSFRELEADSRPENGYPEGWAERSASLTGKRPLPVPATTPTQATSTSRFAAGTRASTTKSDKSRSSTRSTSVFSLLILALLAGGWWQRNEFWYTAERGAGYAF